MQGAASCPGCWKMAPFMRADKRESQTCATARKFQDSEFTIDQDLGELVERGTIWGRLEEGQRTIRLI